MLDLNSTNGLVNRRLYGDGQDDVIAKQTLGGVVTWYLTDHLGSVQSLLDNSGISVGTLAYLAFGSTTTNTGSTDRYQYTGREADAALGLQFNRDRMYFSSSGRWLSEDPSGFGAGDPNLMRYVGNGPTNGRDPSGNLWAVQNENTEIQAYITLLNQNGINHSWYGDSNAIYIVIDPRDRDKFHAMWEKLQGKDFADGITKSAFESSGPVWVTGGNPNAQTDYLNTNWGTWSAEFYMKKWTRERENEIIRENPLVDYQPVGAQAVAYPSQFTYREGNRRAMVEAALRGYHVRNAQRLAKLSDEQKQVELEAARKSAELAAGIEDQRVQDKIRDDRYTLEALRVWEYRQRCWDLANAIGSMGAAGGGFQLTPRYTSPRGGSASFEPRYIEPRNSIPARRVADVAPDGLPLSTPQPRTVFINRYPHHEVDVPRQVFSIEQIKQMQGRTLNYVVTHDGKLIIGRIDNGFARDGGGGHIDLAGGKQVFAAGEVVIRDGKIKYLDNSSGHYMPKGLPAQQAAEDAFKTAGFEVEGKYIEKYFHPEKGWIPLEMK